MNSKTLLITITAVVVIAVVIAIYALVLLPQPGAPVTTVTTTPTTTSTAATSTLPPTTSNTSTPVSEEYTIIVDILNRTVKVPRSLTRIVAIGPGMLRLELYMYPQPPKPPGDAYIVVGVAETAEGTEPR